MPPDEPTEDNQEQPVPQGNGTPLQTPTPGSEQPGSADGSLPETPAPAPDVDQEGSEQDVPPTV